VEYYNRKEITKMKKVKKNDVIQIALTNRWAGCLAIVDEVKEWGVQCFVEIPLKGTAFYRVNNNEFEVIGEAVFILAE
jgi:hypothetical protein